MSGKYKERCECERNTLQLLTFVLPCFRIAQFDECLNNEVINTNTLKTLCYQGVPEGGGRRALAWRLLLGYLPAKRKLWSDVCQEKRKLYSQLVSEMIVKSPEEGSPDADDHPLNLNPTSQWQSFFKDNEVLLQIDKDVRRLCPDLTFFQQATAHPNPVINAGDIKCDKLYTRVNQAQLMSQVCSGYFENVSRNLNKIHSKDVSRKGVGPSTLSNSRKRVVDDYSPIMEVGQEAHWEVVQRILFLYAKLNPGQGCIYILAVQSLQLMGNKMFVGYVQGMNEIIGPIYYVLASDSNIEWRQHAEADCFFCFTNLMSDIRDFFIKTLDDSSTGIQSLMVRLQNRIHDIDSAVAMQLDQQGIKMQYFAFRWLSLMLSQEFSLPDVLTLWDALLTDDSR